MTAVKQTFGITDMVLRDVRCSILATRVGVEDMLPSLRIPRSSGHPFHEHLTTDSTLIRPPIPRASG
ncbi:hypothetical protein, partial [Pseudomonas sp. Ga0074129]|uniref:hypothetical protein n=1 Tax=Pseudomonas sp. Ga0074129 TaxID=1752219 RepID=UPI000ACFCFF5